MVLAVTAVSPFTPMLKTLNGISAYEVSAIRYQFKEEISSQDRDCHIYQVIFNIWAGLAGTMVSLIDERSGFETQSQ